MHLIVLHADAHPTKHSWHSRGQQPNAHCYLLLSLVHDQNPPLSTEFQCASLLVSRGWIYDLLASELASFETAIWIGSPARGFLTYLDDLHDRLIGYAPCIDLAPLGLAVDVENHRLRESLISLSALALAHPSVYPPRRVEDCGAAQVAAVHIAQSDHILATVLLVCLAEQNVEHLEECCRDSRNRFHEQLHRIADR